jgi:translation initiation factor IF-2
MAEKKHSNNVTKDVKHSILESGAGEQRQAIDLVLKCDTVGSVEAVSTLVSKLETPEAQIKIIRSGVGNITKEDLLMALSGSRLVLGFNVEVAPRLEQWVKEHSVEIRLYKVIYRLAEDLRAIAQSMVPAQREDKIIGKCEIIATFKSKKGGIILGCEVVEGMLQVGKRFRVVTAMGPVHSSRIESLQIEKHPVKEARVGQQVGVQVLGSTLGKVGDFIECYDEIVRRKEKWSPRGDIIHIDSK